MSFWQRIGIRGRIYMLLGLIVAATAAGGAATFWYAHRLESLLGGVIRKELDAFQSAESLVVALAQQKGFVSYYFIDGDPEWLRKLGIHRGIFSAQLEQARRNAVSGSEKAALDRIENEYHNYTRGKDQVIEYYKSGDRQTGARLHGEIRSRFFRTLQLCMDFKDMHSRRIEAAQSESRAHLVRFRISAVLIFVFNLMLVLLLMGVLLRQIFGPLRRLAREASPGGTADVGDDVKSLSRSVRGMIKDIDDTHVALEKSREHLLQAEKMAVVGKLAAGMAHSIRNPFTSLKMRLFSLSRSLKLNAAQQEDFDVVSEEIRHIDTIVQNFLEFSRPPKLQIRSVSPSTVVDMTLQLLSHRLKTYDVSVTVRRERPLPEIDGDPEQLKEVLVNLIINACESMEAGGRITIRESMATAKEKGPAAVVCVEDDGPGMSNSVKEKIFEPFFTTKEEGTGLGLSIAARIMEEHGGRLGVDSSEGDGTVFILTFPLKEPT
jgi:signal transduction histidine kinase